jgi:hypothetical protein
MVDTLDAQEIKPRTPQATQTLSKEIPATADPVKFIHDFQESDYFKTAYDKFFAGKKLASGVTKAEKDEAFFENELARDAFIHFGEKEERFNYVSTFYSPEISELINCYIDQTKDTIKLVSSGGSQDDIINYDLLRTSYHDQVAKALADAKIVPSFRIGKAMARLILISRGLETFENSRESDLVKLRRFLSAI